MGAKYGGSRPEERWEYSVYTFRSSSTPMTYNRPYEVSGTPTSTPGISYLCTGQVFQGLGTLEETPKVGAILPTDIPNLEVSVFTPSTVCLDEIRASTEDALGLAKRKASEDRKRAAECSQPAILLKDCSVRRLSK